MGCGVLFIVEAIRVIRFKFVKFVPSCNLF